MTRLLNPSPGEIEDRLTILEKKIEAFHEAGVDANHLVAEQRALRGHLEAWRHWIGDGHFGDMELAKQFAELDELKQRLSVLYEKRSRLRSVNRELWEAEDDVRLLDASEVNELARLAKHVANLNDERARLVNEISALYGDEQGQEKLYGTETNETTPLFHNWRVE